MDRYIVPKFVKYKAPTKKILPNDEQYKDMLSHGEFILNMVKPEKRTAMKKKLLELIKQPDVPEDDLKYFKSLLNWIEEIEKI